MKRTSLYIVVGIFLLGCFLRFYQLGNVPFGFHRDEAFLGYNAYSVLKTAKDMHGDVLPLHFASFLYSPAGYSYFSIPFIALFGLSAFSVRFASAFFSVLTIPLVFVLVREIFKKTTYRDLIAIVSTFLLAISPWHLNLSRTTTENTIVLFFIVLASVLLLAWMHTQKNLFLLGAFIACLVTLFTYQAPRAFLPFFVPLVMLFGFNFYPTTKKLLKKGILFYVVLLIPIIVILLSKDLSLRVRTVSIFGSPGVQLVIDEQVREDGIQHNSPLVTRAFHNKGYGYFQEFTKNYMLHFSYPFLFTDSGFPDRYRVPLAGLMYLWELPFLLVGIYYLFKEYKNIAYLVVGWIILVPIGSGLTFDDVPNLQRTVIILPGLIIASAVGAAHIYAGIKKHKILSSLGVAFFSLFVLYTVAFYFHQYYVHTSVYRPWYRHDGYKELVMQVNALLPDYEKAVITNRESAPTIFFLFYSQYDPAKFQEETNTRKSYDYDRIHFSKYEFSQEECPTKPKGSRSEHVMKKGIVYVNSGLCEIPVGATVHAKIYRKDGSHVFTVLSLN